MTDYKCLEQLSLKLGCKCRQNQMLKNYTTMRVGGSCPLFIEINSVEAVSHIVKLCNSEKIPYIVLGKGSNVLIDDNGIKEVVLYMGNDFSDITFTDDNTIKCEAGLLLTKLCMTALEHNLTGLEFAYGIPASVGGAVYMNAGAYNGEINDVIVSVQSCDKNGSLHTFTKDELEMSYRKSIFKDNGHIILNAEFVLSKAPYDTIKSRMSELMEKRKTKQPLEYPSAGSMFKRPAGSYAGMLIEQSGLKGFSVGGAEVSTKHCGFVINKNNATFDDLMKLISCVKNKVFEKTGYTLECEPVIISDR